MMHKAVFELKKRLQEQYGDRLRRFMMFGSYVRGEHTYKSDIDILISLKGPVDWNLECELLGLTLKLSLNYST